MEATPKREGATHAGSHEVFATTRWSVVRAAGLGNSPEAEGALEKLCQTYWYPIYAQVRRDGQKPEDAQDLTQGFFAQLLKRNSIAQVKGEVKFRSFLLGALKHFLIEQRRNATREKRGGGRTLVSIDAEQAEGRYQLEPADPSSPEKQFDRTWAVTVLGEAIHLLGGECAAAGKSELFGQLRAHLIGDDATVPHAEVARRLHISEGTVKVTLHRLRKRYGEIVREVITQTVEEPGMVEQELRALMDALAD